MNVVLTCDKTEDKSRRFCDQLKHELHDFEPRVYGRIESLILGLQDLVGRTVVCVCIMSSRSMLIDLLTRREMLGDPVFVLVLPDQRPDTIELAHQFSPHFVGYLNDSTSLLKKVIERIIGRDDATAPAKRS